MRRTLGILALLGALTAGLPVLAGPAAVGAGVGTEAASTTSVSKAAGKDPRRTRGLFVDPLMKAAQFGSPFQRIGGRAQPLWLTDYYDSPGRAAKAYVQRAEQALKTPLLVVYNIPDRDCGLYSSQDDLITDAEYRRFVSQVAAGLRGSTPIVVLEPDAIPFIGNPACTGRGDRLGLLRYATRKLADAGAWVYIDAGHSGWQTPQHMAPLLKQAGIASARGFATNVANTRATPDEKAYATALLGQLKKRKVTGVKWVLDTSRNGAGRNGPENGDVCNPLDARLGAAPKLVFKGSYDGNLWVKLPGESDGPCNGGPNSGEFFPTGACRLMYGAEAYFDDGSRSCLR